jgi:predicted amidohydrolase YtcJ
MSLDLMLAAGAPAPEGPCQADLVAINGHVYTVNASQPWAEAIAVCGSAYAEFTDDRKGRLQPGYLADFVVLSKPHFDVPPLEILETHPVMTVVGGKVVYEAK